MFLSSFIVLFIIRTSLSFSSHLKEVNAKAKARIGLIFSKLPIKELPIELALRIFDTYVLPIYRYGLVVWLANCSKGSLEETDSVYTCFLKKYLGVPKYCNNAISHYLTSTEPLSIILKKMAPHSTKGLSCPKELTGTFVAPLEKG